MSKLTDLVKEAMNLNTKMHNELVALLKANNGIIRTDNVERRKMEITTCDNMYVISMEGDDEPNTEHRIMAVALIGEEQVAVLPDLSGNETISGLTDQEVLELNDWEWINGGYVHKSATLESICECIEEYLH